MSGNSYILENETNLPEQLSFSPAGIIVSLLLLLITGTSCSNSYTGKANTGHSTTPVPGSPHFSIHASSYITENNATKGDIFLSISKKSLIFKKQSDSLVSRVNIYIEIKNHENDEVAESNLFQQLFFKSKDEKYYEMNDLNFKKSYDLDPGIYDVQILLTDLHSGKETSHKKELQVPDPSTPTVFVNDIQLLVKESADDAFIPLSGYNLNSDFDSLKFTFQVTNGHEQETLNIQSQLVKFRADTTPARSMSGRNHRSSSIEYLGLDYSEKETIQTINRELQSAGSVSIENSFDNLSQGNYRFEVSVEQPNGKKLYRIRDFAVKSTNYPQVKTARELARPLVYLMKQQEYSELMSIESNDSLKAKIDKFWLNNIGNSIKAKTIIRIFYQRVEEANIQFDTFKEGWKTDPGMIYILFGPPLYTDDGFGEMSWLYDFDSGSRSPNIQFEDPRYGNNKFPFDNFLLERSPELFSLEYRQLQSWLDGSILFLTQN